MKIAVCGCSWSSRDIAYPDLEFGQLIADYYDAEYINLGKPACSNPGIALQIDYLLDGKMGSLPDLVIINATTVTRTELKLNGKRRFDPNDSWDNVAFNMLFGEKFRDEHAPGYGKGYDPSIVVDSFSTIFGEDMTKKFGEGHFHERYKDAFTPASYKALKQWFLYFFDADVERYKQQLILFGALLKLKKKGVKFIFCPNTFDWAEDLYLQKNPKSEFPEKAVTWEALEKDELLYSGIAESLWLENEIYGSYEKSPGCIHDNHLPMECHMDFTYKVISHINRHGLAK
tara:strand:- start:584 stop:1444 length:861 start_codon:yes stop_codon:yes gene_type:complete